MVCRSGHAHIGDRGSGCRSAWLCRVRSSVAAEVPSTARGRRDLDTSDGHNGDGGIGLKDLHILDLHVDLSLIRQIRTLADMVLQCDTRCGMGVFPRRPDLSEDYRKLTFTERGIHGEAARGSISFCITLVTLRLF